MKKRVLCFLFTLVLCAFALPMSAFAADDPLCFTAEQANSTVALESVGTPDEIHLLYSTDGKNWDSYGVGRIITLENVGDKVYFLGNTETFSTDQFDYYYFAMTGKIAASGSMQSLINNRTDVPTNAFRNLFSDCASLTTPPELPATELAEYSYSGMFCYCTSLKTAPELKATTLAEGCCTNMFCGCTSLTEAQELPATTLADRCYYNMFYGCTSLRSAPKLPATTLADWCYMCMFYGCTGLSKAPELPATKLARYCYYDMFCGCTSLTKAPELPATELADGCYMGMFQDCTGIKLAETKTGECYSEFRIPKEGIVESGDTNVPLSYMFEGTSGITNVNPETTYYINFGEHSPATVVDAKYLKSNATYESPAIYFKSCRVCGAASTTDTFTYGEPLQPLCFTAEQANSTVKLESVGTPDEIHLLYSTDGKNWDSYGVGRIITLENVGDKVYFFGNTETFSTDQFDYYYFAMTGKIAASGSVQSLVAGQNVDSVPDYAFCYLFQGCTSLTQAPELPATSLGKYCYEAMFSHCTGLSKAPELPATTLADRCYYSMFYGCTSLRSAPKLPATTLADWCYMYMFCGCTGLSKAPELPATKLARYCYYDMFCGCTSLTKAPELPATELADGCYMGMFQDCTGIKLAETKTGECYSEFRIPKEGIVERGFPANVLTGMFTGTSGVTVVNVNTTYYFNFEDHSIVPVEGKAATCEKDGFNEYYQCEQCGDYFADKDGKTLIADIAAWKVGEGKLPAGHSFTTKASSKKASDATCTAPAKYYVQCDRCDAISDTVTVAVGDPLGFPFTDVEKNRWSYNDIAFVYEKGLMNGTSDTTFAPTMPTSRAMIVTILFRMSGDSAVKGTMTFKDVKAGMWYTEGIRWASAKGIVNGYSETQFGPDDSVTREQLAVILYRYAEYKGDDVSAKANLSKYSDSGKIASWAKDGMSWANAKGLITETDKNMLLPRGVASREQVAAVLHRFLVG